MRAHDRRTSRWQAAFKRQIGMVFAFVVLAAHVAHCQSTPGNSRTPLKLSTPAEPLWSPQDTAALVHDGDYATAQARLEAQLQASPQDAEARFMLGYVLYRRGQFVASLAAYTDAAGLRSPTPDELIVVASDYIQLRSYPDAARWLRYVTEHAPTHANAWYLLGRTEYLQDRQEEALAAFEHCLQLQPRNLRAKYNEGLALERLQRPGEAEAAYRQAITWADLQQSRDPQPWLDLGNLLLIEGKPREAASPLAEAVRRAPANPLCQQQLGVALMADGRAQEAVEPLQRATFLAPDAERAHFYLARAYKTLNRKTDADAEYAKVARLLQTRESTETPNPETAPPVGGDLLRKDD